jgi:endonuclease/exonuclease/phosphatase family metal-dependent hydrolase
MRGHSTVATPGRSVPKILRVLTRNLFLGADLMPAYRALAAPDALTTLPAIVAQLFNPGEPPGVVQRTDFAARAAGLADEIEAAAPDLIGLQEAAQWRTDDTVASDHLDLLEAELARRGLRYRRVAAAVNGDVALPSAAGFNVGLRDREAILARDDEEVLTANVQTAAFVNTLPIVTPNGTFALARGWMSVDATVRGTQVRLISTHLEVSRPPAAAAAQLAQAGELLAGPADTSLPVVMLGDFNSRPDAPTYAALRAAGFDDAWTRANPSDDAGFTCCHRAGLADPADTLRSRIDLILTRGAITATEAFLVGHRPADMRAGLWPSDHAGVVATLEPV